jgi:hypothetical protein
MKCQQFAKRTQQKQIFIEPCRILGESQCYESLQKDRRQAELSQNAWIVAKPGYI